jgi:hypothetical protein
MRFQWVNVNDSFPQNFVPAFHTLSIVLTEHLYEFAVSFFAVAASNVEHSTRQFCQSSHAPRAMPAMPADDVAILADDQRFENSTLPNRVGQLDRSRVVWCYGTVEPRIFRRRRNRIYRQKLSMNDFASSTHPFWSSISARTNAATAQYGTRVTPRCLPLSRIRIRCQ